MSVQKPIDAEWLSEPSNPEYDDDLCAKCDGYEDSQIRLPCICASVFDRDYIVKQKIMKKEFEREILFNDMVKEVENFKKIQKMYKLNMDKCEEELESCKRTLNERNDEIKRLKTAQEEDGKFTMCQMCNAAQKSTAITCQHVFCLECAVGMFGKSCPICKTAVTTLTKLKLGWARRMATRSSKRKRDL